MPMLSYNETEQRQLKLRHIFLPGWYGFTYEAVIGIAALLIFNLSELSGELIKKNFDNADPLSVWHDVFHNLLDGFQRYDWIQQALLFVLWAMVGALIYVLVFRILQVMFGVKHSVGTGLQFVRKDHARGVFYWLASLHDFFLTSVIVVLGGAAVLFGSIVCFGIASQELKNGLTDEFPTNAWEVAVSLIAAILSIRLIFLGISLLSGRFRNWYTS